MLVVFTIYNVIAANTDRNDIIKANTKLLREIQDVEHESASVLKQVITNEVTIQTNQAIIKNLSASRQNITNDLIQHEKHDQIVQNQTTIGIAAINHKLDILLQHVSNDTK